MLRKLVFTGAQHHGGKVAPLFLLLGVAMLCLLPILQPRVARVDENAVGHMSPHVTFGSVDNFLVPTVSQPQRLVRGRRSPGSEIVAVYVNTDEAAATSVANALIHVLRSKDNMACDVQFYFVNSTEEWPVPHAYTRSALVLNMSKLNSNYLCFDTLASNGMQPNHDLPTAAMEHAQYLRFELSYLCQKPGVVRGPRGHPLWHYWQYLESSVQLSLRPERWHQIPTHSINVLTLSSDASDGGHRATVDGSAPHRLVELVLRIIVSLNGLEEKFHHSTFVWLPISVDGYVEYDAAQFCIILFVASMFSTAYAEYQLRGISITPCFLGLLLAPAVASAAFAVSGWTAVALVSLAAAALFRVLMAHTTSGMWMSFNAIALCLLIILQPACGLLAGLAAACQVSFIHPAVRCPVLMLVGSGVSWVLCLYFVWYLQMPLLGFASISELYISFVIFPNAVWITSRFLCTVI